MGKVEICNAVQVSDASASLSTGSTMMTRVSIARTKKNIRYLFLTICFLYSANAFSQMADAVYKENIQAVRFHLYGDQEALPV